MIRHTNDAELLVKKIDEKYIMFYQVWKELTDKRTMDSYQYRVMNSLSILSELNTVIGMRLNRSYATNHNVDECRSEAVTIIKRDSIIKKHYPSLWQCLIKHLSTKTETDSQLRALYYQIQYAYEVLASDYVAYLVDELEKDINSGIEDQVIIKTNMLISCCATKGWSTTALWGLVDILLDSATDITKWEIFKKRILSSNEDNYIVYIPLFLRYKSNGVARPVMAEKVKEELRDMGISVLSREKIIESDGEWKNRLIPDKDFMVIPVQAFDYYSACHKAIDNGSDILSLLSFYNYIESWNSRDLTCWVVNEETLETLNLKSKRLYASYDYMYSNYEAFKAAKNISKDNSSSLSKKLHASYAYANMGKDSGSQEEKFMNIWVALESLCRSNVYENIISNVLETVPPALCSRYIYLHFRNFIEDCERCEVNLKFSEGDYSFCSGKSRQAQVKDIISILRNQVLTTELEKRCNINRLLHQRYKEMNRIANNREDMFNKIIQHHSNVRKQLSRLYRIRNSIAHTGMISKSSLIIFIEHLEDYLASFVSEVIRCANKKQENSAEVVFEIIKDNYNVFADIVSSKKQVDTKGILSELTSSGIVELV